MSRKLTREVFQERSVCVHGDIYDYSLVEYIGYQKKVKIVCRVHGVFEQTPDNHLHKCGCPSCANENISKMFSSNKDVFEKKAAGVHNNKFDYSLVEYKNAKVKIKIICPTHGEFEQIPDTHLSGKGCPSCAGRPPTDTAAFVKSANEVHSGKYLYNFAIYKSAHLKVKIVCSEHGVFEQNPASHLQGCGCPNCATEFRSDGRRIGVEGFIKLANEAHPGGVYDYSLVEYKNTKSKVKIVCKKHGIFRQNVEAHLNGHGCSRCVSKVSKPEQELFDFIIEMLPDARQSNRVLIKPKEVDIIIPSKKIAIEFNGLHYHSDRREGKMDNYHLQKSKACEEVGYRLIHIWEDDWRDRQNVIKKNLQHMLGFSNDKVFARKCKIGTAKNTDVTEFFEDNHIQGGSKGGFCYTLTHNDEIVAAMIFGHHVSSRGAKQSNDFELIRYATSKSVIGGASRLLSAFLKNNPNCKSVISYSNNEMYSGNMYEALGFKLISVGKPDYKVVINGKRRHKSGFTRSNLKERLGDKFDPTLTERENCRNNDLFRVYNCGLTKWVWTSI